MGNTFIEITFANKEPSSQTLGCQLRKTRSWRKRVAGGKGCLQMWCRAAASETESGEGTKRTGRGGAALRFCSDFKRQVGDTTAHSGSGCIGRNSLLLNSNVQEKTQPLFAGWNKGALLVKGRAWRGKGESRPLVVGSGRTVVVLAIRCTAPKLEGSRSALDDV